MDQQSIKLLIVGSIIVLLFIIGLTLFCCYDYRVRKYERNQLEVRQQIQNQYQSELQKRLQNLDNFDQLYHHPNRINYNYDDDDVYNSDNDTDLYNRNSKSNLCDKDYFNNQSYKDYFNNSPNHSNSSLDTYI